MGNRKIDRQTHTHTSTNACIHSYYIHTHRESKYIFILKERGFCCYVLTNNTVLLFYVLPNSGGTLLIASMRTRPLEYLSPCHYHLSHFVPLYSCLCELGGVAGLLIFGECKESRNKSGGREGRIGRKIWQPWGNRERT